MDCKRFFSIPVFGVFMLMGFVYYVTIFVFVEELVGLQSSAGILNASLYTFLSFLCIFSFFVCVLTDPGDVPPSYIPDVEESVASDQESRKNAIQLRRCEKCTTYKPPRTHHCRVCRRCVLKMDHHCLWINNCVGFRNYKAFFILVFYATLGVIYSTVIVLSCAYQKDWDSDRRVILTTFYVTCGIMMAVLTLTFGALFVWHMYLISHNMTTIEYREAKRATWLASKSGQIYQHPYDINAYKNISSVMGPNILKWLCPAAVGHLKDGTNFPTLRERS